MKKVYISVCIIITILLVGCNSKIVSTEDTNVFDKIKSELELIPKNYSADNAIKDGCFVILNEEVKSELEIMNKFVSDSRNERPTSITIVQSPIVGETIITKIIYDGTNYYGIEYNTGYTSTNPKYYQFQFKYLKIFKENGINTYCLFNDNGVTYSKFIKSMISSNSNDWIDHQIICNYKN